MAGERCPAGSENKTGQFATASGRSCGLGAVKSIDEDSSIRKNVAPPQPGAALVVARWNAWVRVWFPDTDETTWVNLEEIDCEILPATGSALGERD